MIKKIFLAILAIFILIQLIPRPAKNTSAELNSKDISTKYPIPTDVKGILQESCNDCHTNNTVYPWYAQIQPLSFWLANHIKEGKQHLNFSEFLGYSPRKQYHKLEEVEEMVNSGEMPLSSYTIAHSKAKLNTSQKSVIINWSKNVREQMKQQYPSDSLVK